MSYPSCHAIQRRYGAKTFLYLSPFFIGWVLVGATGNKFHRRCRFGRCQVRSRVSSIVGTGESYREQRLSRGHVVVLGTKRNKNQCRFVLKSFWEVENVSVSGEIRLIQ